MMSETIAVTITKPNEVVWQGDVSALESMNSEGEFAIIPEHARFMTILIDVPITLYDGNQPVFTCAVGEAVLFFENNIATVFIQPPTTEEPAP